VFINRGSADADKVPSTDQCDSMKAKLKALLIALLEPPALREAEKFGDLTSRLVLMEDAKSMPWGAVWDAYCESQNVPAGTAWLAEVKQYEASVLSKR
jgi:L-rhamnose isomerase